MPNPENIEKHKWKKGQSGNPKGRPKKIPDLGTALALIMGEKKDDITALEMILMKLRADAVKGNIRAAELLLKYSFPNGIETQSTDEHELIWGQIKDKESNEDNS